MADATVLEAPATPAPLFAYRALKGFIWGSPNDDELENKENLIASEEAERENGFEANIDVSSPSPCKHRSTHLFTSPSKSILRIPGVPTPRRLNANVTFKDVRLSLSPEIRRRGILPSKAPETLNQTTTAIDAQEVPTTSAKRKASRQGLRTGSSTSTRTSTTLPATRVPNEELVFDFEAYKILTEKEMKKLVRYGQKMREYARKQDEENALLRVALGKLKKENEELRQFEERRKVSREGHTDNGDLSREISAKSRREKVSKTGDKLYNATPLLDSHGVARLEPVETVSGPQGTITTEATSCRLKPSDKVMAINKNRSDVAAREDPVKQPKGSGERDTRQTSARLPPDRLMAARERIRLKAERRKVSEASALSLGDWAGL